MNGPVNGVVERLRRNLQTAAANQTRLIEDSRALAQFEAAAALVVASYRNGGRLYIAGNGGSAADAQHLAAELVVRLGRTRPSIPAEALTVDASVITAMGNDFSFEEIFSRQLEGKMGPKDVFLAITTSGNSPNIVRALKTCRERGLKSLLLTGRSGGVAKEWADVAVIAPGENANEVQEVHLVIYHTLCAIIEDSLTQP